ncbi:hypothetical protein TPY_2686 [Sulfobacillus acidophilus TPY]|nr:hypothetical protein TPY_2686 [Sulfobacillus acidophilus TPY]
MRQFVRNRRQWVGGVNLTMILWAALGVVIVSVGFLWWNNGGSTTVTTFLHQIESAITGATGQLGGATG